MPLDFERLNKLDLLERIDNLSPLSSALLTDIIWKIESVDQFIKDTPSFPGSTDKIIRSEMTLAIGSTLAIEGVHLNPDEIEESFRKADANETLLRKEQEAQNSRKVYEFIIQTVNSYYEKGESFEFSEALIRQLHNLFTQNMNYIGNIPGEYRGEFGATFGYPRKEGICKNRAEVELAMSNFVKWLNQKQDGYYSRHPLVKAIMAHYYLTEIHPYSDGNGRTARALEALILYLHGINTYCFWSLANFWSTNRDEYIAKLGEIRSTCEPLNFIDWGLRGYLEEVTRIKEKVLKKLKRIMLKDYTRFLLNNKRTQEIKINQRIVDVIHLLIVIGQPVALEAFASTTQVKTLYRNLNISTWYRDLAKMNKSKLITISLNEESKIAYIEPNFSKLDTIIYNV